jgi:hypothetical protein
MATLKEVKVDISAFDSIQAARLFVEELDHRKVYLNISGIASGDENFCLALIDRWTRQLPGRVFLSHQFRDSADTSAGKLLKERLPEGRPQICWSGKLIYAKDRWTGLEILSPSNPDRLPVSDELHILCALNDDQLKSLQLSSVRPPRCVIEDALLNFDNYLVISPGADRSDCRLFFMTLKGNQKTHSGEEYTLHPVSSPSFFAQMYRSVIERPKRGQLLEKPFMLRTQAVGTELLLKSMDEQALATVRTRKQLNVMKAVSAFEDKVLPFFATLKTGVKDTSIQDGKNLNFENILANKRINKLAVGRCDQSAVNHILKQLREETGSVEDAVYSGKRFRRLLGTSFSSHKWPFPPLLGRDQLVAGAQLSEVLGELL